MHPLLAGTPPFQLLRWLGGEPHRAATSSASVAEQLLAEAAAAEDPSVGKREPVAPALDDGIAHTHVECAGGVLTEGRTALELGVRHQQVIA